MLTAIQLFSYLADRLPAFLAEAPWRVIPAVHEPQAEQDFIAGFELVSESEIVPGNYTMRMQCRLLAYAASGDVAHSAHVRTAANKLAAALHSTLAALPCGSVISSAGGSAMLLESSVSTLQVASWSTFSLFTIPFSLTLQQ